MNEYENEPVRGLPETLPPGENLLWQGEPDWRSMARRTFRLYQVGAYFALLIAFNQGLHYVRGGSVAEGLGSLAWQAGLGAVTLALLAGLAWLFARSTVYSLTNKRVVLRFGVAIPMMINLPLDRVQSADLRDFADGSGDIALRLEDGERISYWALWPHAKPWNFSPVVPMLRSVPRAQTVDSQLGAAAAARGDVDLPRAASARGTAGRERDNQPLEGAGALA
jgi:hypothetical protein